MDEKLAEVEKKYEGIEEQLSDASVVSDMEKYRQLMKDYKEMTPLVEKYRALKKAESDLREAEELLSGGDPDLKELAEEQVDALTSQGVFQGSQRGLDRGVDFLRMFVKVQQVQEIRYSHDFHRDVTP